MPAKKSNKANLTLLLLAVVVIVTGLGITIREGWSSPSRSGGRVSGSNLGLDPRGRHRPPFSERAMLLPYPSYEYSLDPANNVSNSVQSIAVYRHLNQPNVLSFLGDHIHPTRDIAPISPPGSIGFLRSHPFNDSYTPLNQRFYLKNRLGDPIYTVQPSYTVPTIGGGYRKVGIVFNPNHPDLKLPLFGRPKVPGGNRFDYYVMDDSRHANELPLEDHNGLEIVTDDVVRVPGYDEDFAAYIY